MTINDIKAKLPEIIELIDVYRELANSELRLYNLAGYLCLEETTNESADFGVWTSEETMTRRYNNYKEYTRQADILQEIVNKIPLLEKNI